MSWPKVAPEDSKECLDCDGTGTTDGSWEFDPNGNLISLDISCKRCSGQGFYYFCPEEESFKDAEVA
jgi:hypothetical protein